MSTQIILLYAHLFRFKRTHCSCIEMAIFFLHELCRFETLCILSWTGPLVTSSEMSKDRIREIYEFFFKTADTDGDGFVTGPEAAALFRKSGISDSVLVNVRT